MLKYDAEFNTSCNLYEFVKKDAIFEKKGNRSKRNMKFL